MDRLIALHLPAARPRMGLRHYTSHTQIPDYRKRGSRIMDNAAFLTAKFWALAVIFTPALRNAALLMRDTGQIPHNEAVEENVWPTAPVGQSPGHHPFLHQSKSFKVRRHQNQLLHSDSSQGPLHEGFRGACKALKDPRIVTHCSSGVFLSTNLIGMP